MTPAEFAEAMSNIDTEFEEDIEVLHRKADELMVRVLSSLGYAEGCYVFEILPKNYA